MPKLHFLGAPAARSYGPALRRRQLVHVGAVTRTVLKSPRRRTVDLGRRAPAAVSGPDVPGTSLPTHARQALGRHADDRCAGRRRGLPGPGHRLASAGHPCGARRRDLDRPVRATSSARSRWTLYASRVRRSRPRRRGRAPRPAGWVLSPRGRRPWLPSPRTGTVSSMSIESPLRRGRRSVRLGSGRRTARAGAGVDAPRCWFPRTEADLEQVPSVQTGDQAGDQGELLLRHERQGVAGRHPGAAAGRVPSRLPGHRPVRDHRPEMIREAERAAGLLRVLPGGGTGRLHDRPPPQAAPVGLAERAPSWRPSTCRRSRASQRFLKAVDYHGLAELECKRDPRDGPAKLLDVNARTWGYHSIGTAAGVDFPYLLYRDQLGSGSTLPGTSGRLLDPAFHRRAQRREGRGQGPLRAGLPEVAQGSRRRCGGR